MKLTTRRIARLWSAAACLAVTAPAARAQAAGDTLGWHFVGDLGYVQTSGNTRLSTVNLGEKLSWRPGTRWTFTQTSAWVYGKTAGVETANQVLAGLRADYGISARLSGYALAGYERNPFAGIARRTEEVAGLSWKALTGPKHVLDIDVGAGSNQQISGGVRSSFLVGRYAPKYRYNLTDKAYVEEAVEVLTNLEQTGDTRATSSTALVAPLTARIAIRLGYLMRYDAEPALNTGAGPNVFFRKLDTTFTSGIQVSL